MSASFPGAVFGGSFPVVDFVAVDVAVMKVGRANPTPPILGRGYAL